MKKFITIITLSLICFFCPAKLYAQLWNWGIGSVNPLNLFEGFNIAVDPSGNVYESGFIENHASLGTPFFSCYGPDTVKSLNGENQLVLVSSDPSGSVRWAIGSQVAYQVTPTGLVADSFGHVYLFGTYNAGSTLNLGGHTVTNPSSFDPMYFLAKINSSGNVMWLKNIANQYNDYYGYTGGLSLDAAGYVYLSGVYHSATLTFGSATVTNSDPSTLTADVFVVKYDTSGTPVWAKSFGGRKSEFAFAQAVTRGGDTYVTGFYDSDTLMFGADTIYNATGGTNPYIFVVKYDKNGNRIWAKSSHSSGSDKVSALVTDNWNNVYLAGATYFGVAFGTASISGMNNFIIKFDKNGNPKWAISDTSTGCTSIYGITSDNCGNIWTTGGEYGLVWGSPEPMFVSQFDTAGHNIYSTSLQGGGDDQSAVITDNAGHLYIAGDYGYAPVAVGFDTLKLVSGTKEAFFMLSLAYPYGLCTPPPLDVSQVSPVATTDVSIFPNPAFDECTISVNAPLFIPVRATIYDMIGKHVATYPLQGNSTTFNISTLNTGTYICNIEASDKTVITKKLVVIR